MRRLIKLPQYAGKCGWNALLPPRVLSLELPAQRHHDCIVVGAGFTGLAAARRFAELAPDASVLVLESSSVGEGSSGRNAGFAVSVPFNARSSPEDASAADLTQLELYASGLSYLEQLVRAQRIECGWNPTSKIHAAATLDGEVRVRRALDSYRRWGIDVQVLDRKQILDLTGTGYYRYGFLSGRNVLLQPAALVRGLADSLPDNAHIIENITVTRLSQGKPHSVSTSHGTFTADKVILANNSFVKEFGFLRDRLVTIYTYAALTPLLSETQCARLGGPAQLSQEWGILPANRMGTTIRRVAGRRVLIRSAYSYEHEMGVSAASKLLQASFKSRFPDLESHDLEFVWGGTTALTSNGASFFGEVAPGVLSFAGCNGSGIVKCSINGAMLAEFALGRTSPALSAIRTRRGPGWMPPEPFREIGARTAITYQAWRAGAER